MNTHHIHFNSIVQGVGFRPMVYQLANQLQVNGYVKHGSDGVHVYFNASDEKAILFFDQLKTAALKQAKITSASICIVSPQYFTPFDIVVEEDNCNKKVWTTPDAALCADCRMELLDTSNRRYRYPFISCTQCGPRCSIVTSIPYERQHTTMNQFEMCKDCDVDYEDLNNLRFFSQTNSCSTGKCKYFGLTNYLPVISGTHVFV